MNIKDIGGAAIVGGVGEQVIYRLTLGGCLNTD